MKSLETHIKPYSVSSINLCLNCPKWTSFRINQGGWWCPNGCNCWSKDKTHVDLKRGLVKYGPMKKCDFSMEHDLMDDRRNFNLDNFRKCKLVLDFLKNSDNDIVVLIKSDLMSLERRESGTVDTSQFLPKAQNWLYCLYGATSCVDNDRIMNSLSKMKFIT